MTDKIKAGTEQDASQVRQHCRVAAVELAAALQLTEGLGLALIEEMQQGSEISDELGDKFVESLDSMKALFERTCPKTAETE